MGLVSKVKNIGHAHAWRWERARIGCGDDHNLDLYWKKDLIDAEWMGPVPYTCKLPSPGRLLTEKAAELSLTVAPRRPLHRRFMLSTNKLQQIGSKCAGSFIMETPW